MNKWAIVGLGFISERHFKAIEHIGGEVILACDIDPEKAYDFEDKNVSFYQDFYEMISSLTFKEVTHVAICTPNYLHAVMINAIKGKVVLCEKPLTFEVKELEGLKKVWTVLQLRHHPMIKSLVGNPVHVQIVVKVFRGQDYWFGWKGKDHQSGGIIFNLGIHYLDLLIYLLGNKYDILKVKMESLPLEYHIYFPKGR